MKKVVIAIIASLAALSLIIIISSQRNKSLPSPQNKPKALNVESPKKVMPLENYSDPSGFVFQHPATLSVSQVTPLANSYYANVEASVPGQLVKASVIIESTIVKSLADFKKTNIQIPKNSVSTKLADLDAIEYDTATNHITQAIDEGVLITVSTPLADKSFWEPIHRTIISTFKFSEPSQSDTTGNSTGGTGGDDIIFEGEETVE